MALPKILNHSRGFTLIEVIIVVAIVALVSTLALFLSMDSYRNYSFRTERDTVVSMLQKSRAEAMANINQAPHGVHIDPSPNQYVIFEGSSYNPGNSKNEVFQGNISHGSLEVVFNQVSGNTSGGSLTLQQGSNQSVISINNEGQITWTK